MKVRTRLSIIFTIISSIILLVFALIIYYSASKIREKEFYLMLKNEAITKANLFVNSKRDKQILQNIHRNYRLSFNEVGIAIYDNSFQLLYKDSIDIDTIKKSHQKLSELYSKDEIEFYQNDWQIVGIKFNDQNNNYFIIAAAYDKYGFNQLNSLKKNIIITYILAIVIIFFASRFLSNKALYPVKKLTEKAREISLSNLNMRIETNNREDELSKLAITFNEMLERLNKSFESQNQFVSHLAHELRTPLAAMITELELAVLKDRTIDEYKTTIKNTYRDSKKMARLISNLLDFTKANYDSMVIKFKPVRIDEVLLDAKLQLQKSDAYNKIDINFVNEIENEESIMIKGNEYFLKVAFINLFENACKYSHDKHSTVYVSINNDNIELRFTDKGIGIPKEDLPYIFEPFYRGKNKDFADGSGIGLALVKKIISLHNGNISVESTENNGSTFIVTIPNLKDTL